jgi:PilZ domain
MQERRKSPRRRTLKSGRIGFNRTTGIDCRVRNLSLTGACLELASQIGVPDDFVLLVESNRLQQPCHVVWRAASRLGVEFCAA